MFCFYHKVDLDGSCSAAIVKRLFPECELYPISYEDSFPWDKIRPREKVFMVDFSLKLEDMRKLNELCDLVWCDHHITRLKPAQEAGLVIEGKQDSDKAGCVLVWEYFAENYSAQMRSVFGKLEVSPFGVALLGWYDIGQVQEHAYVLPFQFGMRLQESNPEAKVWDSLLRNDIRQFLVKIVEKGYVVIESVRADLKRLLQLYSFTVHMHCRQFNYTCLCLNDEMSAGLLMDPLEGRYNEYDLFINFVRLPGRRYKLTVASKKPGVHCGNICQGMQDTDGRVTNGGGHEHVGGMIVTELPWIEDAVIV